MVALQVGGHEPTRREPAGSSRLLWRAMMAADAALVAITGRLEVTGDVPAALRDRPLLLAANHIGNFDAFVLVAACRKIGVVPRFLATGGLFDTPVIGWGLRATGHIRVDRGKDTITEAFARTVDALRTGAPVLAYPEGRISHDPGLWPELGKTGVARMALAADVPVVPVSQWGAHEAAWWGTEVVTSWADLRPVLTSWLRALRARPRFRVHFGDPVDLGGLSAGRVGDARRARDAIMRAIAEGLAPLRAAEPELPRFRDPTRPTDRSGPWRP
jgi:1-acyl-sn-glycerol-3-phosphate acyltransferase